MFLIAGENNYTRQKCGRTCGAYNSRGMFSRGSRDLLGSHTLRVLGKHPLLAHSESEWRGVRWGELWPVGE